MKVGIIGFGGAGSAHYEYFQCVPGCEVVRIFDPKPEGRARAARYLPPHQVCSELALLWEGLDAVSVCTPDDTHADYIVEALSQEVHVLCEKPLTDSRDGIVRIMEATATSRMTLAVLHQMRFVPLFVKLKRAIDEGDLGRLSYIEGYYVHDLTTRAFQYDNWRSQGRATPMVYAGCHFVDLLRWLVGEEPSEVVAMSNHLAFPEYPEADLTAALLRFPSSVIGKVLVSIGTAGPQDHSVRAYGDIATVENAALFDKKGAWTRTLHKPTLVQRELLRDARLTPRTSARRLLGQLSRNGRARMLTGAFNALRRACPPPGFQYGPRHFPLRLYEHQVACVAAIEDFVRAARTGGRPVCAADDSAQTILACLAALEASRTNAPARVQPLGELTA